MSLVISFPVIGLDQVLRTPAANFAAQPLTQIQHWVTDSLMAVPLFAIGVWASDLIAGRAGIGTAKRSDLLKRSLIIALLSGLALAPAWFEINKSDNPIAAQPLVFPQAHDSGDVYSVAPGVIIALVCVCLVPAALWAGRAITRAAPAVTRAAVPALLVAVVPVLAWLMYETAGHAYASQVYYTRTPAQHVTPAPDAFTSQAAHALQDGLAGQAAGIPVAVVTAAALQRGETSRRGETARRRGAAESCGQDAATTSLPYGPADKS